MTLSPAWLDELRMRTTLSALIGRTTKLQKSGREWKACCPFHNEKTPSFWVNDEKGFYHCFGCGAHGDAIRWMTDQRGLAFMDAVKELAESAGMDVPAPDRRSAERAEKAKGLHEACADAAQWFTDQLNGLTGTEARAVLERRGVKPETARAFGLGFAPDSRRGVREALKDYGDPMLVEAGLLVSVDGKEPYDRFRGRLMIPIRDPRGRVIAFGGRIIGDGEPKYLNSPETPLFDKGRQLYNLDRAQAAARKANRLIAVEGYMDVIALAQAGFAEVVAPLGTAMTEHQLERMWRVTGAPVLCFDGDKAGQRAAIRAAHRALPLLKPGFTLTCAMLPAGMDPDELVNAAGPQAFEGVLARAVSLSDLLWRSELELIGPDPGPDARAVLLDQLMQRADAIQHPVVRDQYRGELRNRFYDIFGSRARRMAVVQSAAHEGLKREPRNLLQVIHRAVLLGVMRYPEVLRARSDDLHRVVMATLKLAAWRDTLVEMSIYAPEGLVEELTVEALNGEFAQQVAERRYDSDLAFTFYFAREDRGDAVEDLNLVIDTLLEEQENRRAGARAHLDFERAFDAQSFDTHRRSLGSAQNHLSRLSAIIGRMRDAA